MSARVLIVDDEKLIRWSLRERLSADGYDVSEAEDVGSAEALLKSRPFDVALFDMKLPDGSGLDLLRRAAQWQEEMLAVIITAHSSVDTAVAAMKEGAFDYISKPFNMDAISMTIRRALETHGLRHTLSTEMGRKKRKFGLHSLVGESDAFCKVKEVIQKVAATDATSVLLLGETGTGKDMAARAIHYESSRAEKPFMNITCTAMPESLIESEIFGHEAGAFTNAAGKKSGLFELGHNGTVFLDEIGDMPASLQPKLLRVLEERAFRRVGGTADIRVDCRVVAATHRDLAQRVESGEFREDLFYRLNTIPIILPPLRERREDIVPIAAHFLEEFARKMGRVTTPLTPAAEEKLTAYAWPGNVRELRNVMERAVLLGTGDAIEPADLILGPAKGGPAAPNQAFQLPPEGCNLADVERALLTQALHRTQGNQTHAAQLLGVTRDQVRYKAEKYGLGRE